MADIQIEHGLRYIDQGESTPQTDDDGHHEQQVIEPWVLVPQAQVLAPNRQHLQPPGQAQGDGQ